MSIFSSRVTKTIEIPPHIEAGDHTVTIRKLAGRHLHAAHQAFIAELFLEAKDRGGSANLKDMALMFEKDPTGAAEEVAKVQADPLNGYDKFRIVKSGVVAYDNQPVEAGALDELDDEAVEFLATEIMRLTKPARFLTGAAAEAERKNG